jgi:ferrochelatase
VLLLAYGAPRSLDEVERYLLDVRGGRPTPPDVVKDLVARYAAIGGTSPLLERTREQAVALATALGGRTPVYVGMRHWHPYIKDVLAEASAQGVRRAVVIALAPHFSRMSTGAYQKKVEDARGSIEVTFVSEWHNHPRFLDAVAGRVRKGLAQFPAEAIVFTAHSLPERILADGDPYTAQLRASVEGVMARVGEREHVFAFQSAGRTGERWLGPDAGEVLDDLAARGRTQVLLCPIGFVADHLEVLYDIDIDLANRAKRLGVRLERAPSLNASPLLIEALVHLVQAAARKRGWVVQ